MRKLKNFRLSLLALLTVSVMVSPATVLAATSTKSSSKTQKTSTIENGATNQAVTQGYGSDTVLQNGMIVMLDPKDSSKVAPLTTDTVTKMQGVVVAANDATVTIGSNGNKSQVFVATFGHYDVLVSNQNGPIKAGDYITISALAGVGMKVDTTQPTVLGKATADFSGSGTVAGTAKLKDSTGKEVSVSIGRVPIDISISHNPLQQTSADGLPGFLRSASEAVAGKPVSTARVYIALVVLLVSAFVAGGILYSGVRGGLIAIGRNPMAKKQIVGGIIRVVLSGLICFILGIFGVYLLLKL
ncbi:MAG TPA: hypothetical protein VN031_03755 [Candidatus Microsaccharimonas sp.]|nr:hypothetical protein [Candidatus Microsaccharimonas sp.]